MANPVIPIQDEIPLIVTRISRAYRYPGGERTEDRILDESGRPISRVRAFGRVLGSTGEVTLEAPDAAADEVATGDVIAPGGDLRAELRGGDFGAVEMKIRGVEQLMGLSTADSVFDGLQREAQKAKRQGDAA